MQVSAEAKKKKGSCYVVTALSVYFPNCKKKKKSSMENIFFSLLSVSNLTTRAYCKIRRSILISSTSICYCYSNVYLRLAEK